MPVASSLKLPRVEEGDTLSAKQWNDAMEEIERALRISITGANWHRNANGLHIAIPKPDDGIPFRNDSGSEIPAYGVVRITGAVAAGSRTLTADQPNTYGSQFLHFCNSRIAVASGGYGVCYQPTVVIWAKYNTGDGTPAIGESWGPVENSHELRKYVGGFQIVGAHEDGRVLVVQAPMLTVFGKTDSAITKGSTGTVSIWHGAMGSETDSTRNFTAVLNRFGDIDSGSQVLLRWHSNGSWEVKQAECPV